MSVGLDIYDPGEWVIVTLNEWVAPQLVQFANRLRDKDLYIHCFVSGKKGKDYDSVWWTRRRISETIEAINSIKITDEGYDPIKHKALVKKFTCIVLDPITNQYVEDKLLMDVFLDWVDYRQFHSDPEQLAKDMEDYGFTVDQIDATAKPKEPKAKRHAAISEDDNELLAGSILNIFAQYVNFDKGEDKEYVDPNIKDHYLSNVRPSIMKMFRIFGVVDFDDEKNFESIRRIILDSFLKTVYDKRLGRDKHIFESASFRRFVDGHKLAAKIVNYSMMFQMFYADTLKFAKSKDEFEKKDIDEFLETQVGRYTKTEDEKLRKVVRTVIKEYFKLFVTKRTRRKVVNYHRSTVYELTENQIDLPDLREILPF